MSMQNTGCKISLENLLALEGQAIDFFMELDELEQSNFRSACGVLVSAILRAGIGKELGQSMSLQDWSLVHLFLDYNRWPLKVNLGNYIFKIAKGNEGQPFVCFDVRTVPAE